MELADAESMVPGQEMEELDLSDTARDTNPIARPHETKKMADGASAAAMPVVSSRWCGVVRPAALSLAGSQWQAQIHHCGVNYFLGLCRTEIDAGKLFARAYYKLYVSGRSGGGGGGKTAAWAAARAAANKEATAAAAAAYQRQLDVQQYVILAEHEEQQKAARMELNQAQGKKLAVARNAGNLAAAIAKAAAVGCDVSAAKKALASSQAAVAVASVTAATGSSATIGKGSLAKPNGASTADAGGYGSSSFSSSSGGASLMPLAAKSSFSSISTSSLSPSSLSSGTVGPASTKVEANAGAEAAGLPMESISKASGPATAAATAAATTVSAISAQDAGPIAAAAAATAAAAHAAAAAAAAYALRAIAARPSKVLPQPHPIVPRRHGRSLRSEDATKRTDGVAVAMMSSEAAGAEGGAEAAGEEFLSASSSSSPLTAEAEDDATVGTEVQTKEGFSSGDWREDHHWVGRCVRRALLRTQRSVGEDDDEEEEEEEVLGFGGASSERKPRWSFETTRRFWTKRKNDCGAGDNGGKYSGGPEKEILVDGAVVGWRSAAECGYVSEETGQPSPLFLVRYQVVASPSSASPSSSLSSLFEEDLDACDLVDLLVPDMTEADEAVRASLAQKATENEDSGRNDDNNDAEDDASGGGGGRDGEGAPRVRHHLTLCGPFVSFVDGGGAACDEGADFARRRSRECGLSTLAAARVNRSHDSNCPGLWDAGGLIAPSSTATLMLLRSLLPPRLMRMRGHGPNGGDDESLDDDDEEHNDDDLDDDIGDRGSTLRTSVRGVVKTKVGGEPSKSSSKKKRRIGSVATADISAGDAKRALKLKRM
jgi:hypothetical protein